MAGLNVESSAMHAAIQGFENTAQDLMTAMGHLRQFLDQDASSGVYKGAQAQAFNQVRTQVENDLQSAGNALSDMASKMKTVFNNYQHGDGEAATEYNKLTGISSSASSLGSGGSGLLPASASPSPVVSRLAGS
jgi:uncharacterized protein YukE